jgi:glycosyltransferase involved in cell wall biosynthesis
VIPVFNGGADLGKCLTAVAASSYRALEIILVDDSSTDGMTEPATALHAARLIKLEQRRGPACARNCGVREARGDIIFFTDADVLLHPDAISVAVGSLDADPHLSAVFGSYDDQPGHAGFLSQYRNLYHHWVHQTARVEASTFWTGCGAIRREAFIGMGGFSEAYRRPSIEDIELGSRLRGSGLSIRLEKTMLGTHLKQWTFWNMLKTDIFFRGKPWVELMLRNGQASSDLNLSLQSRIAAILAGLFGLSLLVFPAVGHSAAIVPAAAFLLASTMGAWLCNATERSSAGTVAAASLAVMAPIGFYMLAPDPWATVPMILILALVWTQLAFFRWIAQKRSVAFALAAVPMQLLFFLGCAAAVPLGFIGYYFGQPLTGPRVA